jgi:tetratricopeptide (TPR) repeat protein
LKNYDEAKANYRSAIALNDSFDNAYIKLAYLHLNLKEYDDANANFEKILKISKNEQTRTDAEMQIEVIKDQRSTEEINKGVECAKSGKFEDAIKYYESALKFKRDYRPYYYQAAAYRGLKKVPEAVNAYQQSLAISEKPEVYKGLAGLYLEQKDFEKAIANYEKAAAKEEAGRVYVSWGIALFKEKAFDKAIEKLTIANQSNETDLNYYFIAQAFGEKKKYADADTAFNKVLTLQKTITPGQVAYSRGVMYKAKGDMNKAIEQFKLGLSDEKVKKACKSEIDYYEAKLKNEKKK